MKIYALIGCILTGIVMGVHDAKCPNDKNIKPEEILTSIIAWPTFITMAIVWASMDHGDPPTCKN